MMTTRLEELYDPRMTEARARFAASRGAAILADTDLEPTFLTLFLIHYSLLGVALTRPVEDWLIRSSRRCTEMGLTTLGRALRSHAKAEAGHDQMMVEDTHALVAQWNASGAPLLDAERLLQRQPTAGGRMYRQLHEDTIAGSSPFAQIAIEYEIELLPVQFGPILLDQCRRVLGADILKSLSFLREHITLDVAHSRFNARHLDRLLQAHPEHLDRLVAAGWRALEAYTVFLNDCIELTREHVAQLRQPMALAV